jgi:CubicO group peptidase (beta-lactamase class C family)
VRRCPARSESLPASEPLARALDARLARAQSESRLPSLSAAVFRAGDVLWSSALGVANAELRAEATPDTQYRVGSITKTFTAAAVLQLRDTGELTLDTPVGDLIPDCPHPGPTVRRLLAHLSGIQREPAGEVWESLDLPERDEMLARLDEAEQVLEPGQHWHYSNLGFVLLGEVVERVSNTPYRDYLAERILRPLGLARTTFSPEEPAAQGYFVDPFSDAVRPEPPVDLRGTAAAGQLWSTTGDLARWASFLADPDPAVLAPATAEEMRAVQAIAEPERWLRGWGLGLELNRRGDRVWAGHGGAMPGHLASFVFRARERAGAVVLSNTGSAFDPTGLALDLGGLLLEHEPPPSEPWAPGEPPPEEVAPLLGRWWSEGHPFELSWRGGRLEGRSPELPGWQPPSVFAPEGTDMYRTVSGRERGELLRVVRDDGGAVVKLYWATYPFTREPRSFG